jgi:hypothetical protein
MSMQLSVTISHGLVDGEDELQIELHAGSLGNHCTVREIELANVIAKHLKPPLTRSERTRSSSATWRFTRLRKWPGY